MDMKDLLFSKGAASIQDAVSAVVVTYNSNDVLVSCLESLVDNEVKRVVVVDTGSLKDPSESIDGLMRRGVDILRMENRGYGAAVNRGILSVDTPYVLVCNADVRFSPKSVQALMDVLVSDEKVVIAGPCIRSGEGEVYPSARRFPSLSESMGHAFLGLLWPSNRFTSRYHLRDDVAYRTGGYVDWVSGACFMARRDVLIALSGFDESYFMYLEDVDLCWRAREMGWLTVYAPQACVTHLQGVSTAGHPYMMTLVHHLSVMRFASRTLKESKRTLLPFVAIALVLRLCVIWLRQAVQSLDRLLN